MPTLVRTSCGFDGNTSYPYASGAPYSTPANSPVQRGTGRLVDKTTTIISTWDNNKSTSASGEKNNTQKIYFYKTTDFLTYTLIATVSTGITDGTSLCIYSMCIDDSNNIHVVYVNQNYGGSTRGTSYIKLTFATGAWTNGSAKAVSTGTTTSFAMACDIDLVGTGSTQSPVIQSTHIVTGGITRFMYVIPSDGTGTVTLLDTNSAGVSITEDGGRIPQCSIAGLHEAFEDTNTTSTICYIIATTSSITGYVNFSYKLLKFVVSSGSINSSLLGANTLYVIPASNFPIQIFTSNTREFTILTNGGTTLNAFRLSLQATGIGTVLSENGGPVQVALSPQFSGSTWWMTAFCMIDDNTFGFLYTDDNGNLGGGNVWIAYLKYTQVGGVWQGSSSAGRWWSADSNGAVQAGLGYQLPGITFSHRNYVWAGGNTHCPKSGTLDLGFYYYSYTAGLYQTYGGTNQTKTPPTVTLPAINGTIQTDTPNVAASVGAVSLQGIANSIRQGRSKLRWQAALDAAFSTNLVTYTDADTALQRVGFNLNGGSVEVGNYTNDSTAITDLFPLTSRIPEGPNVYIRAAEVDEAGGIGPYSASVRFINSHPPAASNASPGGGKTFTFGTGVVTFSWYFTDPWAQDNQTSYEIQVIDMTTGNVINDTGKLPLVGLPGAFNTLMSATVTISGTYTGRLLAWQVKLWDSDDVSGNYSGQQTFYLTVPPVVNITAPTNGSTLTTPVPTLTWTDTLSAATQVSSRVIISQGTAQIYDSGAIPGTALTFTVPLGVLQNAQSYTFSIYITDSNGLTSAGAQTSVNISLTPPAAPGYVDLFTYDYESLGFVWISWDNANIDPAFYYWNVYRRAQGDTIWTLIDSVTQNQAFYGVPDYTAKGGVNYQYCVTQVILNSGASVESAFTAVASTNVVGNYYWLIDALGQLGAVPLYQASKDTLANEYERNSYVVVGRGRHVDIGEHLGMNGTVTCQLRDKQLNFLGAQNCFADPSFQNNLPFSPQWVITATGSVNYSGISYLEPAPSGHVRALKVDATTGPVTITQVMPVLPGVAGQQVNYSIWIASAVPADTFNVTATVVYKNAAGATLSTSNLTLAQIQNWQGNSRWFRYATTASIPAGAIATMTFSFIFTATATGLSLVLTGCQATNGATPTDYIDGDLQACSWDSVPYVGSSSSTGFYTARQQRLDIEELAALDRPLYLRTPFGDLFYVSPGDISFDRLAGVGPSAEFGDLTIPYLEVAL